MATDMKTKPVDNLAGLTLEEQVLLMQIRQSENGHRIWCLLTMESEDVLSDSVVRIEGEQKRRKLAFADLDQVVGCELLINNYQQQYYWPKDKAFENAVVKRIFDRAQTWEQYQWVCRYTSPRSRMYRAASDKLHELLRAELQGKLETVDSFNAAADLLHYVNQLCTGKRNHIRSNRLNTITADVRNAVRQYASGFGGLTYLLSEKWVRGDERTQAWNQALALAKDAGALIQLAQYEPIPGLCLQMELDRCTTVSQCMEAAEKRTYVGGRAERFQIKATELVSKFDQLKHSFRGDPGPLFVRHVEKFLNLAQTEDELLELIGYFDNLRREYRYQVEHLHDRAVAKLGGLYNNHVNAVTTFAEYWQIVTATRYGHDRRVVAFEHACRLASASSEYRKLQGDKMFSTDFPDGFNPVRLGIDAAEAAKDTDELLQWSKTLDGNRHHQRTRAMELFVKFSQVALAQ